MDEVTIQKYPEAIAAHLARVQLEAQGIEAWIGNEHFTSVYPLFNPITGGVELKVAVQDAPQAAEILHELQEDAVAEHEARYQACPECGGNNLTRGMGFLPLLLLTIFTLGIYPLFYYRPCRCNACGHRWR